MAKRTAPPFGKALAAVPWYRLHAPARTLSATPAPPLSQRSIVAFLGGGVHCTVPSLLPPSRSLTRRVPYPIPCDAPAAWASKVPLRRVMHTSVRRSEGARASGTAESRGGAQSGNDSARGKRGGHSSSEDGGGGGGDGGGGGAALKFLNSTAAEAALGASAGVVLLGFAAMGYQAWYKEKVLAKMEGAFEAGYDPVVHLNHRTSGRDSPAHVQVTPPRPEEELVRRIVAGAEAGRYFLILGPKGTGKTTAVINAMAEVDAEGCAFFEAHEDHSVACDRFSESINFSQNRDYLGNLLGLSDLSGMSTYQQLERALHKLERALIRYKQKKGRPAVIIMNHAHLLQRDSEGARLLQLFQQRAEKWAGAGTATFVFISNDYFVFDVLRKNSNRMDTLTFKDLDRNQARQVLETCRRRYWARRNDGAGVGSRGAANGAVDDDEFEEVYQTVGGRVSLLSRIATREDMRVAVRQLVEDDTQWLLSKTGMIADHDDDVMDSMKWAYCSWLLFRELAVRQRQMEQDKAGEGAGAPDPDGATLDGGEGSASGRATDDITDPTKDEAPSNDIPNPYVTWGEARVVMTRPDFLQQLDEMNVVHIDRHHHVRADSLPMLRAFQRVMDQPGFEELLQQTMDRVSAIESLGRTRELVWKEQGARGRFLVRSDGRGRELESWALLGGDERLGREDEADKAPA